MNDDYVDKIEEELYVRARPRFVMLMRVLVFTLVPVIVGVLLGN